MTSAIKTYRDLVVWQRSVDLVATIYAVTKRFPTEERFALTNQLQRSAVSIAANIAEGHGKSGSGHYLNHLSHARGSLREVETLVVIADRVGYLNAELTKSIFDRADEIGRMLHGLTVAVTRSSAPGAPRAPETRDQ